MSVNISQALRDGNKKLTQTGQTTSSQGANGVNISERYRSEQERYAQNARQSMEPLWQKRKEEANKYNQMADYYNAGQMDYETSNKYREEAATYAANSKNINNRQAWQDLADRFNRAARDSAMVESSSIDTELRNIKNSKNADRSAPVSWALATGDLTSLTKDQLKEFDSAAKSRDKEVELNNRKKELASFLKGWEYNGGEERTDLIDQYRNAQGNYIGNALASAAVSSRGGYMPNSLTDVAGAYGQMTEARNELENFDIQRLNIDEPGEMTYTGADKVGSFASGMASQIGSSLADAAGTTLNALNTESEMMIQNDQRFTDEQKAQLTGEGGPNEFDRINQVADSLNATSQKELAKVKQGLPGWGQVGVDIATTVTQMGFDAGMAAATGGNSLAFMFARVFGQEAGNVRREGGNLDQQLAVGLGKAAIEVATEKIFDGVAGIYGKGAADDVIEGLIGRLTESDAGRTLLRAIAGAANEGVEEVLSDLLSVPLEAIATDKTFGEAWASNTEDILYDFLLGAAVGGLGSIGSIATGQNRAANAELRANETLEALDNIDNVSIDNAQAGQAESQKSGITLKEVHDKLASLKEALSAEERGEITRDMLLSPAEFNVARAYGLVKQSDYNKLVADQNGVKATAEEANGDEAAEAEARKQAGKGAKWFGNRHEKIVNPAADKADALGYTADEINKDEAYETATAGAEQRLPTTREESLETAEAPEDTSFSLEEQAEIAEANESRIEEMNREGLAKENESYEKSFEENMPAKRPQRASERRIDSTPTETPATPAKTVEQSKESVENGKELQSSEQGGKIGKDTSIKYDEYGVGAIDENDVEANGAADYVAKVHDGNSLIVEYGDKVYEYDGETLTTTDGEDVIRRKAMSPEKFAAFVDDAVKNGYPMLYYSDSIIYGRNKNGTSSGDNANSANGASQENKRATPSVGELGGRSEEVSRGYAEKDAQKYPEGEVRDHHLNIVDEYVKSGASYISEAEYAPFMDSIRQIADDNGIANVAFFYRSSKPVSGSYPGGTYSAHTNTLYVLFNNSDLERSKWTVKHELTHKSFEQFNIAQKEDLAKIVNDAFGSGENGAARRQFDAVFRTVRRAYAYSYSPFIQSKYTQEQWLNLDGIDQEKVINGMPEYAAKELNDLIYEEFICEAVGGNKEWFIFSPEIMEQWQDNIRDYFIKADYVTAETLDSIDSLKIIFESDAKQTKADKSFLAGQQVPTGSHTVKQSQSKSEERQAGKGKAQARQTKEDAARIDAKYGTGDGTYLSETNAERSRIADHRIAKDRDGEVTDLVNKETWSDEDTVAAEKLRYDMLMAIRDYQLKRNTKMSRQAFDTMCEQYNALTLKYKAQLSEAGQKLQANYNFTTGQKIIMKAAETFLGFTEDGRFAGANPKAKNAKLYAAVETAVKRVEQAVENNDAKALKKVFLDFNTIRGVEKMFGPFANKVMDLESKALNNIANYPDGIKLMENLAYGTINGLNDDVQPYKHLNAAKTIRVMNMLSNMATINNNVSNNWMQGLTDNNALAQAMTQIAQKPFENLTGMKAVSKSVSGRNLLTKAGREAHKEIRNAEIEMAQLAFLMQMSGIDVKDGKLELKDQGRFNPNANPFESLMALYKFGIGLGVEATDQIKSAGLEKGMELGIERDIAKGKIDATSKEVRMKEAKQQVRELLYKDDNVVSKFVQQARDALNHISIGNEKTGTIGLGDLTMAFAKVPANVIRARLLMTPEGAMLQLGQYVRGVMKAKRMHSEVLARGIAENKNLSDSEKWRQAEQQCSGQVYKRLREISQNYAQSMSFDRCCERAGYMNATEMSQFEAAQLSRKIGRAATSAGMMALGSVLQAFGALKDFDEEPDENIKKMMAQKGYSGLMLNFSAMGRPNHEWRDGDTIIGADFLEVVALPLTIGATAAMSADTGKGSWMKSAFSNGLAKTFDSIGELPGMADAVNFYTAVTSGYSTDDVKTKTMERVVQYLANALPSFIIPNAYSQLGAGLDNTMRDTYSADNMWMRALQTMQGKTMFLRRNLPASVDIWGEDRTYGENTLMGVINKTLLPGDIRTYKESKYEKEIARLLGEGMKGVAPKATVNGSFEVDGETYTMDTAEKRDYRMARNKAQAEAYKAFMDSDWYKKLDDLQRTKVLQALKTDAERDAKQDILNSRQLDVQVAREKWETELPTLDQQIAYLSSRQMAATLWDSEEKTVADAKGMDAFLKTTYKSLNAAQKELLNNSYSHLDDMYDASKAGINSSMWQKAYDVYRDYTSDEGRARVDGGYKAWEATQMWTDIERATGANSKQMEWFEEHMKLYNSMAADSDKFHELVDTGWSRDSANALIKNMAGLTPQGENKTVSYKQRMTTISTTSGLTEEQRWEAFFAYIPDNYTNKIKKMQERRRLGYTFHDALVDCDMWMP